MTDIEAIKILKNQKLQSEYLFENVGDYTDFNKETMEALTVLLNLIEKLQKDNEELLNDNYAYHTLMEIQSKREYRSKFFKDFQEEFGRNTFPDFDEVYKRYDKQKKQIEKLRTELNSKNKMLEEVKKAIKYDRMEQLDDYVIYLQTKYLEILGENEE